MRIGFSPLSLLCTVLPYTLVMHIYSVRIYIQLTLDSPQNLTINSLLLTRRLTDNIKSINTYFVYSILCSYKQVS